MVLIIILLRNIITVYQSLLIKLYFTFFAGAQKQCSSNCIIFFESKETRVASNEAAQTDSDTTQACCYKKLRQKRNLRNFRQIVSNEDGDKNR